MFQGVLALLGRSLRVDSRSWQVHLARMGLMLAIYIWLALSFATSFRFGAPGLRFFRGIVWLNVMFMSLLGIGFFSTAISEEKEEDTLGLMQMAGLIPLGILFGKVGGRLCQALLLIAVQYPFTLLAITMGGVTSEQVRCAFVGLTAYMLFLAGLGLLCSTVGPRNRTASGLMILGLVAYTAIPYAAYEARRFLVDNGLISATSIWASVLWETGTMCLFLQINSLLASSFGESPWTTQAISNVLGGATCFLAAWGLFAICTRNPSTESTSRGLLGRRQGAYRWFSPGRPRFNPFLWKDFYFVGGGIGMVLVRVSFYVGLMVACHLLAGFWWGGFGWQGQYPNQWAIGLYQTLLLFVITVESAVLATRTLHEEVRGQTLVSLVMLPESLTGIVYSKLAGSLLAGLPGLCCLASISLFTQAGMHNTGEFLDKAAGWFFLSHFALVPNLSMVLAMYMRWGGVPLAIGVAIGSLFGWVSCFEAFRVGQNDGIVAFAAVILLIACIICHTWIVYRLPLVAARS